MKKTLKIFLVFYLLFLIWLILFKFSFHPLRFLLLEHTQSLNLIPFAMSGGRREVYLNVLVFIPFGLLLYPALEKSSFGRKLLLIILLSLSFETLQYFLEIGASDITDVITNSFGGLIGLVSSAILSKILGKRSAQRLLMVFSILMIGLVIFFSLTMFLRRYPI
ncbi:MAG: VanZ family protein [Streptococcaceae bacterium]|nr:VanZ family protein [Streptococcaceae bacterium]